MNRGDQPRSLRGGGVLVRDSLRERCETRWHFLRHFLRVSGYRLRPQSLELNSLGWMLLGAAICVRFPMLHGLLCSISFECLRSKRVKHVDNSFGLAKMFVMGLMFFFER